MSAHCFGVMLMALALCFESGVSLGQVKSFRIIDREDNMPLSNVIVRSEGKEIGLRSDKNGRIGVVASVKLISLHHVGYEDLSLKLDEYPDSTIYMDKARNLIEEVFINTGYQHIPRERSTGSFESISKEALNKVIGTDIFERLEGQSSILFDKSAHSMNANNLTRTMQIRGRSTLYANSNPLIILDNLPFEGDLFDINPNDVESISILKDAAAASIWGARAGNGVIVINTKKVQKEHIEIELNSNFSMTDKPYLYKDYSLNSSEFLSVEKMLFERGFYDSDIANTQHPALSPYIEVLLKEREGLLDPQQIEQLLTTFENYDIRRDYLDYVYQNPLNRQIFTSLSSGGRISSSRVSVGYDDNDYSLRTNSFKRWTLNGSNEYKINDRFNVFTRLSFTNSTEKMISPYMGMGYGWAIMNGKHLYPYAQLVDDTGNPVALYKDLSENYLSSGLHPDLLDWRFVPLEDMWKSVQTDKKQQTSFSIQPRYRLGQGITLQGTYQYQRILGNSNDLHNGDSYYTRNLVNRYSQVSGEELIRAIPIGGILDRRIMETTVQSWRGQVSFDRDFAAMHTVNAVAGGELRKARNSYDQIRRYGYNQNNGTFSEVDFTKTYSMYDGLGYATVIPNTASLGWTEERFVSLFALLNYSYLGKHNFSGSLRNDAANIFGVKTNNKWSPFWSAGYSWNIHKEKLPLVEKLDRLMFRATWGYSGNVDPSRSALVSLNYAARNNSDTNYPYATLSNPTNESLRWEKIGTLNLGLDFALKNAVLTGSLDYFRKSTTDLIGYQPLDPSVGFLNMYANNANTLTHGFDLKLQSVYRLGKINGNATLVLGHAATKVTKVNLPTISTTLNQIRYGIVEGQYYNPIYSFHFEGLSSENGNPLGILENEVSEDYYNIVRDTPIEELIYHGSAIPLYYGNFSTTFKYGDFSLFINVIGKFDYFFRRPSINYQSLYSRRIGHYDYAARW